MRPILTYATSGLSADALFSAVYVPAPWTSPVAGKSAPQYDKCCVIESHSCASRSRRHPRFAGKLVGTHASRTYASPRRLLFIGWQAPRKIDSRRCFRAVSSGSECRFWLRTCCSQRRLRFAAVDVGCVLLAGLPSTDGFTSCGWAISIWVKIAFVPCMFS